MKNYITLSMINRYKSELAASKMILNEIYNRGAVR